MGWKYFVLRLVFCLPLSFSCLPGNLVVGPSPSKNLASNPIQCLRSGPVSFGVFCLPWRILLAVRVVVFRNGVAMREDGRDLDVFLLMGQSNMAGYGCVRPEDPWQPGDRDPLPGAWVLTGQGTVRSSHWWRILRWEPGRHPLHRHQNSSRFGMGLDFARAWMEARPEAQVGLIPCAWGGAPIDKLNRGTPIWSNAVRRARRAARDGAIRGVLWHQGESDTETGDLAAAYGEKLRRLIADFREVLEIPELPWVLGDLAPVFRNRLRDPVGTRCIETVRAALRETAEMDEHVAFVETDGLPSPPGDHAHFNRDALVALGRRYAKAMLEVADDCRPNL